MISLCVYNIIIIYSLYLRAWCVLHYITSIMGFLYRSGKKLVVMRIRFYYCCLNNVYYFDCDRFMRNVFTTDIYGHLYNDWRRTKTTDDRYIIIILPIHTDTRRSVVYHFSSHLHKSYHIAMNWSKWTNNKND